MVLPFITPGCTSRKCQICAVTNLQRFSDFPENLSLFFFDFLYVAYTVGMTFEMSDVGAKTTEVRKVVIVQSLLAFLYTTIAISAFVSLFKL